MVCSSHGFCWRSCYTELLVPFQVRQSWGVFFSRLKCHNLCIASICCCSHSNNLSYPSSGYSLCYVVLPVICNENTSDIWLSVVWYAVSALFIMLFHWYDPISVDLMKFANEVQASTVKLKKNTWLFIESLPGLDVTRDLCFCPKYQGIQFGCTGQSQYYLIFV